ncbi:hypothetical protein [Halobellus rubicundus]|uniref:Uncharacterized protein n=1 Tax=Halobellus rubicundus TaxID=2996466 RepID=A0ABD5MDL3_9EURY
MASVILQSIGGSFESIAQIAGVAGTLVLVLMLVAAGALVYRQFYDGGIEWPDEEPDDDEVSRGGKDDEWEYY